MVNLRTKFEVFIFTLYKDINGNPKCRNLGGLRGSGQPKVTGNVTI